MPTEIIALKFSNLLAGVLGGISVWLVDDDLNMKDLIALVIIGGACSYYLIPAIVEYFTFSEHMASFLAFLTGIMARSVIKEAKKRLTKKIVDKAEGVIDSVTP